MHTNFKHIVFVLIFLLAVNELSFGQVIEKQQDSTGVAIPLNELITDSVKTDSIPLKKEYLEDLIKHTADDYIRNDFTSRKAYLYNNAELLYQDIELRAGIIIIDYKNNLAYAKGIVDTLGNYTQKPIFKQANQESEQDSLIYNFRNEKAIIYNTKTDQDGVYILGNITKRENDSVFYVNRARFTTSNKDKPDYYIGTRNIKLVPGKKVVGGLSQLYLADVPTPAVLPFFYAPLSKERSTSGFLLPTYGENNNQGFFLQNGGYYFAINDYVDLAVMGDVYTNGSWGMRFESSYAVRYKFTGNFNLRFENLITGQRGFDNYNKANNFNVRWSHSQSSQSNPNSRFSASVNMGSSKYYRESLNQYNISNRVTNTLSSSINYYKKFVNTPFNMNMSLNHTQNTNTNTITMTLPSMQVSMDRIYPFAPKSGSKKNALQNIGVTYNLDAQNSVTTTDELFLKPGMFEKAKTGAKHSVSASTNMKALKYITISPSFSYREVWYLKTIRKSWDDITNEIVEDTINGFDAFRDYSTSVSASTTLYGRVNFKKGKIEAIRHVMRPSVSFSYRPDFGYYYDDVRNGDDPDDFEEYSRFENGIFGSPTQGLSSSIGISLNNTLEAKIRSKDSTATESKKISILKNLNFSTSYNVAADSLNWSPVSVSAGTALFDNKLNLNARATLDPYAINANGRRINTFNIDNGGSLFRLTNAGVSASYSLSNDTFKKKDDKKGKEEPSESADTENLFGGDIQARNRRDDQDESTQKVATLYGSTLPWKLSLRYTMSYTNTNRQNMISNNSLQFSGSIELSPKWSVALSSGYDFKNKDIVSTNLSFERDLDSWRMSFNWVPFGPSKTYYFFIGVKSGIFSDLKYDKRNINY